jgi:hypothetical protein
MLDASVLKRVSSHGGISCLRLGRVAMITTGLYSHTPPYTKEQLSRIGLWE